VPFVTAAVAGSGGSGLRRSSLKVLRSYSQCWPKAGNPGVSAQALADSALAAGASVAMGWAGSRDLLMQLGRAGAGVPRNIQPNSRLGDRGQAAVHLLALGGPTCLPLQSCARIGRALEPPLGILGLGAAPLPQPGLLIGAEAGAVLVLNAVGAACAASCRRPGLAPTPDGTLIGPDRVWLRCCNWWRSGAPNTWAAAAVPFSLFCRGCFEHPPGWPWLCSHHCPVTVDT